MDDESAVPEPGTKSTEDEYLEDELKRKRNVLHKKISEEMYKKNPRWYEAMVLVYYMDNASGESGRTDGCQSENTAQSAT